MNFIAPEGEIEAFICILRQPAPTWADGNLAGLTEGMSNDAWLSAVSIAGFSAKHTGLPRRRLAGASSGRPSSWQV